LNRRLAIDPRWRLRCRCTGRGSTEGHTYEVLDRDRFAGSGSLSSQIARQRAGKFRSGKRTSKTPVQEDGRFAGQPVPNDSAIQVPLVAVIAVIVVVGHAGTAPVWGT